MSEEEVRAAQHDIQDDLDSIMEYIEELEMEIERLRAFEEFVHDKGYDYDFGEWLDSDVKHQTGNAQ